MRALRGGRCVTRQRGCNLALSPGGFASGTFAPAKEAPMTTTDPRRVLILGAAGRDFHNFNVLFRNDPRYEVVGFTATQIPKIEGRRYPPELSGPRYPEGLPIFPEADLEKLIAELKVDEAVFSYSDVSYLHVGHMSSRVNAAGASFRLAGTRETLIDSPVPVVAVTAIRTGCGKSQTTRFLGRALRDAGHKIAVVRHPMPYGDLAKQKVQRFASSEDLVRHGCTFEEREEYEVHLEQGMLVYAGVDYGAILEQVSKECDVLLWDGGNNDWPFYRPDVWVTVTDPLRAGHETSYYPGEVNLRSAGIIVVNKVDRADVKDTKAVLDVIGQINPGATVVKAASNVSVDDPNAIKGKRVLCIEDGPTLTHGEMSFGAAQVAAERFGAAEVIDPRPQAVGSIEATLKKYPHVGKLLPAMGYFPEQIKDMEKSVAACDCDVVIVGTPFDLASQLDIDVPAVRVRYALDPLPGEPDLAKLVLEAIKR
jgi:predicted GTPase